MIFYNANTYAGGTYINSAELLQLASGASLGTGPLTVSAGTVDLGGNSQAVTNLNGAAGTITSSGVGAITLTVSPSAPSAFGGLLQNGSGTLSLAMNGPGLLTLSGSNTYSGGTVLSAGTLDITNAASLGSSGGRLTIGPATLEVSGIVASARNLTLSSSTAAISVDPTQSYSNSGIISGNGGLSLTGQGLVALSGINTYTGGTTISAGTLQVGDGATSSGSLGSGGIAIGANSALVFDGASGHNLAISSVISGSGSLTEIGSGAVTLSASNTFTGNIIVSGGTLVASLNQSAVSNPTSSALGNLSGAPLRTITVNQGGTLDYAAPNVTVRAVRRVRRTWSSIRARSPTRPAAVPTTTSAHSSRSTAALSRGWAAARRPLRSGTSLLTTRPGP